MKKENKRKERLKRYPIQKKSTLTRIYVIFGKILCIALIAYTATQSISGNPIDINAFNTIYALEWNLATPAPGDVWEIEDIEKWTASAEVEVVNVIAPPGQSGNVYNTFTYFFTVQNFHDFSDTFNLSTSSSQGWSISLPDGSTVTVDAGSSGTVRVQVTATSIGTDLMTLTATSQTDAGRTHSDSVTTVASVTVPTVTTTVASSITTTSAESGGDVTLDGGATVTARGVCWSTSTDPTTADDHTTDGTGTGSFTSSITGLIPNTTYYVRAYATNTAGTSYGNQVSFTSSPQAPTVTTQAVTNITTTTATGNGNIIDLGAPNPSAHGVCWNTAGTPTTADDYYPEGEANSTGEFSSPMHGLNPNTTYYVRAYATNTVGTSYGNEVSFTTPSELPIVSTLAVNSITTTTARGLGKIIDLGTPVPSAYGVCWNTTGTPTTADNKTDEGEASSTGEFSSDITGLSPNTTYYVRAYATNTVGTDYGGQISFTTSPQAPTVTTQAVTSITATSATGNGNIIDLGAPNPSAHGVCWNTAGTPTTADDYYPEGEANSTGEFSSPMHGLNPNTTYYVRAYATNTVGTSYGNEVSFTTPPELPTVSTLAVDSITTTTARGLGKIIDPGVPNPSAHGVCWNTSGMPTTADNKTDEGEASSTGEFSGSITGLSPNTTYYVRAYATNTAGTDYGGQIIFSTLDNPKISGKITSEQIGISNVILTFSNDGGTDTTDASGNYSHKVLYNWSGMGTPLMEGYTFEPSNKSYSNIKKDKTKQNYTAKPVILTISGRVIDTNGKGIEGVVLVFSNSGGTTLTDSDGYYSHEICYNWTGTVIPVKEGHIFKPEDRSYNNVTEDLTDSDFTGYPPSWLPNATCRQGYQTYFGTFNTSDKPANITVRYYGTDGSYYEQRMTIPPYSRATFGCPELQGDYSVVIESDQTIAVSQSTFGNFQNQGPLAYSSSELTGPGTKFYTPNVCTRPGYYDYIAVQNSSQSKNADVMATYYGTDGNSYLQSATVPPRARMTFGAHDTLPPGDYSAIIESDQLIAVSQTTFCNLQDKWAVAYGQSGIDALAAGTKFYIPNVSNRPGFYTYTAVQNVGDSPMNVTATYYGTDGNSYLQSATVPPRARMTFGAQDTPGMPPGDYSVIIESDQLIAVSQLTFAYYSGEYVAYSNNGIPGYGESSFREKLTEGDENVITPKKTWIHRALRVGLILLK